MHFFLSVAKDGIVSLWDTEKSAKNTKGETYVKLQLTTDQERQILEAAKRATITNRNRD